MNIEKIKMVAPPLRVSESFPRGRNSLPRYGVVGLGWEAMRYKSGKLVTFGTEAEARAAIAKIKEA